MSASTRTSASIPVAVPPAASTSLATVCARPATTSLVNTVAPSTENSSALSRPRPEPDPVITTTLSESLSGLCAEFISVISALPRGGAGDGLDPQVLAEPCHAVFDAVATDAVATERRVGRQVERVVDVHRAGPQSVGHRPCAVLV